MMNPKRPIDNSAAFTTLAGVGAAMHKRKQETEGQEIAAAKVTGLSHDMNGLDITKYMFGMILAGVFFASLPLMSIGVNEWQNAPNFLQATLGNWLVMLLLLVVAALSLVGLGCAMFANIPRFVGAKMRARVYDINGSAALSAGSMSGTPVVDLIYVAIQAPLFLVLVYPFFLLQNAYEVIRVTFATLAGKKASVRGDSGIYYDRMRKMYAQLLVLGSSREEADDMLRIASQGMFTPRGTDLSLMEWINGARDQVLSDMIRRHGPIEQFVGKVSATGNSVAGNGGSNLKTNKAGIPEKYSAI